MSVNKVMLIGNLGQDIELKKTQSQMSIATMRIATSDRRKDASGNWVDHTEWHSVVIFGKTAENCAQYLSKGKQVFVEGRLQTRKWQDKEGKDRYSTEVVAHTVQFLGQKGGGLSNQVESNSGQASSQAAFAGLSRADSLAGSNSAPPPNVEVSFSDDDIPF